VTGLESLKGKKIRAMSADAPLVRKLGASPVAMAGTEMYAAMKRGTIDGVIYPYYILDTYKFDEVTTCVTLPGIHSPNPVSFYMNLKLWKSFSPQIQQAMDRACQDTCKLTITWSDKWDKEAMATAKRSKITIFTLSKTDQQKLKELAREGWKEVAAKSPELKEVVDLIEKFVDSKKGN